MKIKKTISLSLLVTILFCGGKIYSMQRDDINISPQQIGKTEQLTPEDEQTILELVKDLKDIIQHAAPLLRAIQDARERIEAADNS